MDNIDYWVDKICNSLEELTNRIEILEEGILVENHSHEKPVEGRTIEYEPLVPRHGSAIQGVAGNMQVYGDALYNEKYRSCSHWGIFKV